VGKFDFVSGDAFRESLDADYAELESCLANGAWKARHVLGGSIIEAVLIDFLLASGYDESKALTMDLAAVTDICKQQGVVSEKAAELISVVRSYRNLIHPARVIRLQENIDEDTAGIAKSLVDIIVKEGCFEARN